MSLKMAGKLSPTQLLAVTLMLYGVFNASVMFQGGERTELFIKWENGVVEKETV